MRKWKEKYENLKNGKFDARIDELKAKIDNKTANKEEVKEYEKLSKAKGNLAKVENILEYREKLKKELEDIKKELEIREKMKTASLEEGKIEIDMMEIETQLQAVHECLKDKTITKEKRAELEGRRTELFARRDDNNKRYLENQKTLAAGLAKDGKFKKYDDKELEELKLETSSKISKCNMIANSLINGLSWDSIELKLDNWEKKFTKKGEKLSKEEKPEKESEEEQEYIDVFSTDEKRKEYEERKARMEKKAEFAQKHPRLAKIGNWARKVFGREELELPPAESQKEGKTSEGKAAEDKIPEDKSFKEYIKYVAEHGHKNARKEQLKGDKDIKARLEAMRAENRKNEAEKFGEAYAKQSDYRNEGDGR